MSPEQRRDNDDRISVVHSRKEDDFPRGEIVPGLDEDDGARPAPLPSEKDESMNLEADPPLRKPVPTDEPADISPLSIVEEHQVGAAKHSDADTMAEYERKVAQ